MSWPAGPQAETRLRGRAHGLRTPPHGHTLPFLLVLLVFRKA